jgi:excinuclease ABC subunit C
VSISREKTDFRAKLHDVPHKPGVYLMRDRLNRVIYVGKARNLRKRVGQYFMPSRKMTADVKTRALIDSIWDFEFHTVNSEPEALLLEGKLIKEFRPRYNVSFRDDKRFLLVKVDPREDWPRFRLTRFKGEEGARYFGPFAHAGALRQTLAFMRKRFGVLTFGRGNPTERELKSSTYQVPMKLADITAEGYAERVERACEFLEGQSKEALGELEQQMQDAAAKLDFERAAELRNMLEDLRKTTKPMSRYTRDMRHRLSGSSAIDPEKDLAALADALQLGRPPRRMECFDISNISTTHIVASMVCFIDGRRGESPLPAVPHPLRGRAERLRQHGRGGPAALCAGLARSGTRHCARARDEARRRESHDRLRAGHFSGETPRCDRAGAGG